MSTSFEEIEKYKRYLSFGSGEFFTKFVELIEIRWIRNFIKFYWLFKIAYFSTVRRPNNHKVHVPVEPDMAQTVKLGSYHSENLTNVFKGAMKLW